MRTLLLALAALLVFTSCKKGEDDPSMPFKSRKQRLSGEWRMSSGSASFTWANYSELYTMDGAACKNYRTYSGGQPTIYIGKYTLSLTIDKDGKIVFNEVSPMGGLQGEGEWNFNNGVGDEKKKESITVKINSLSRGNTYSGFFNHGSNVMHYRLKELNKKKMVILASGMYYASDDLPVDYQLEYTLEQRD